jgi:hypothetical protein
MTKRLINNIEVISIPLLFLIVFAFAVFRQCGDDNAGTPQFAEVSRRVDSVAKSIQLQPVSITATELPQTVTFTAHVSDSSRQLIERLLYQIDSLKREVRSSSVPVSVCFGTTAIHPQTADTIHVECDAIRNAVELNYRFALRTVLVPETTITIERVPSPPSRWSIALSSGYGAVYQSGVITTAPTLSLSVSYALIQF